MREFKNGDLVRVKSEYGDNAWFSDYEWKGHGSGKGTVVRNILPDDVAVVINEAANPGVWVGIRNFEGYYRNHYVQNLEHVDVQKG